MDCWLNRTTGDKGTHFLCGNHMHLICVWCSDVGESTKMVTHGWRRMSDPQVTRSTKFNATRSLHYVQWFVSWSSHWVIFAGGFHVRDTPKDSHGGSGPVTLMSSQLFFKLSELACRTRPTWQSQRHMH